MPDLSNWLNSCFEENDPRAPVRAFVFGATITSIAAVISCLAVDPTDWKMLLAMLAGAIFLGGGCAAMFSLPPAKFGHLFFMSFELFGLVPLKFAVGMALLPFVLLGFSLFVSVLAGLAALQVFYLLGRTAVLWLRNVLRSAIRAV